MLSKLSVTLALVLALAFLGNAANASTDFSSNEELIGWSEDGLTWVTQVLNHEDGYSERGAYIVYRRNHKVAEYDARRLDALRKKYDYVKLKAAWRKHFKKHFTSKASHRKYENEGGACLERWRLIERANGQIHYMHKAEWHCSSLFGGYAHPSKPFVLLKYMDDQTSMSNDGYCCSFDKKFHWVKLGARLKHTPPGPDDKKIWPIEFCGEKVERKTTSASCSARHLRDLRPLLALSKLTELNLADTGVTNLRPLAKLRALTSLSLMNTRVRDLSPIAKLTELTWLNLYDTQIRDLEQLSKLFNLKNLNLRKTRVKSLGPVPKLLKLEHLSLPSLPALDLTSLSRLTMLKTLDLGGSSVTNLGALAALVSLQRLDTTGSHVSQNELQKLQAALPDLKIRGD